MKLKHFLIACVLAAPGALCSKTQTNWLLCGDFEKEAASAWPGVILGPGHQSKNAAVFSNDSPYWNVVSQVVELSHARARQVRFTAWVATQNVAAGAESFMKASITLKIFGFDGKQKGGFSEEGLIMAAGTTPWTRYVKTIPLPESTARAEVRIGMSVASGKAQFDDLVLELLDAKGKAIKSDVKSRVITDTHDWYTYQPPREYARTPLDLSFLNEKPAGKHGFVTVKDGHFAFQDGTRVRFWGTNVIPAWLGSGHDEMDRVAQRLARLGVNLVRLHHADASWANIFDPKAGDTKSFNPESLDKLDYFLAALKKNGIYAYLDLLADHKFREGDRIPDWQALGDGAKGVVHFSPAVLQAVAQYARAWLGHKNPYTGLALKDDPVLLGQELANESSIFTGFGRQDFPPAFEKELQEIYAKRGGKGKITRFGYDNGNRTLQAQSNTENAQQSLMVLVQLQDESNQSMKQVLEKMGSHGLLTGSNLGLHVLPEIQSNSRLDFMDAHSYWDHPQMWKIGWDWSRIDQAPIHDRSQLYCADDPGAVVRMVSDWKVWAKPIIVTEWNDCWPNEFRMEGPVLMSAYGALQDWDALLQFDFASAPAGSVKMHAFSINTRPDNQPLYQAGALIFRLAYIQPAKEEVVETIPDPAPQNLPKEKDLYLSQPWLPYAVRTSKRFCNDCPAPDLSAALKLHDSQARTVRSSGGELTLNYGEAVLRLDSPKVQGWVGAIGTGKGMQTGMIQAAVAKRNPWAALLLVSLDGQDLDKSGKMALVAVARAEHTGQVWNSGHTGLIEGGKPPILMEGVQAEVALSGIKGLKVTALDEDGQPMGTPDVKTIQDKSSFKISPQDMTAYYLVERQ